MNNVTVNLQGLFDQLTAVFKHEMILFSHSGSSAANEFLSLEDLRHSSPR